jgi:hypothetical protein
MQQHIILDRSAASIKSRSRSKSQAQSPSATAKNAADTDGDMNFQSDSPEPITGLLDEETRMAESPTGVEGISFQNSLRIETASASAIAEEEALKDIDQLLVKRVLQLAMELETQARLIMMHTLPKGSRAEILLRADVVR